MKFCRRHIAGSILGLANSSKDRCYSLRHDSFPSHCSPLFCGKAVRGLDKILCEYWLKELQESMNGCNGHCELTETMLKMALNMIGLNQSLQTTHVKFDSNDGINLCDWVKT